MHNSLVSGTASQGSKFFAAILLAAVTAPGLGAAESLSLKLRERGEFAQSWRDAEWDPAKTAIIVCDMWDSHHSVTAVRRVNEFAPRLNSVLKSLREQGSTIIHSPSDCMPAYKNHPARRRALATAKSKRTPPDMGAWCHRIPGEEKAAYPIDQSDGGEDEDRWENAQWAAVLKAQGRNPGNPWLRQTADLNIAEETDYIASEGDVVWNILEARGIDHVILSGVHTNMCVLGRPFGLRQMVRAGKETVLLRDCTDVMYNPARWPYVSHFTGLDLVIGHIEQHVCPTITSDQILGGEAFRFSHDKRPTLALITPSSSAPRWRRFVRRFLDAEFRVRFVLSDGDKKGDTGIGEANAILIDFANKLPKPLLSAIREHAASAKPLLAVGLPQGSLADLFGWQSSQEQKDSESSTTNKRRTPRSKMTAEEKLHPLAKRRHVTIWASEDGSLGKGELAAGTLVVQLAQVSRRESPVPGAWTFTRQDSGRSVCMATGMGGDAGTADGPLAFLRDAAYWATGQAIPDALPQDPEQRRAKEGWRAIGKSMDGAGHHDLRTLLRTPAGLDVSTERTMQWNEQPGATVFLNGKLLPGIEPGKWKLPAAALRPGDLNLFVFRLGAVTKGENTTLKSAPRLLDGEKSITFDLTHWQERKSNGDSPDVAYPIPPQFGAPTDLIQNWP